MSTAAFYQFAVVTTPKSGFPSLGDLLPHARRTPRGLDIGTININVGSTQDLAAEPFKSRVSGTLRPCRACARKPRL